MKTDDIYAKGMTHYEKNDNLAVSNYTTWQLSLILPFFGPDILEVGAGNGRFTQAVISSGHEFGRFTAIEPSETLFSSLAQNCHQIEVLNSTIDRLGDSYNQKFDTVYSIHVMEHIEDDLQFLKDMTRFLKSDGKIILMIPALNYLMSDLDRNIGHYRRYNKKMIRKLAEKLELKVSLLRYDNFIGIFGWLILCKIMKLHYQDGANKKTLFGSFNIFDKVILPVVARIEKHFPPPIGLNLTVVLEK